MRAAFWKSRRRLGIIAAGLVLTLLLTAAGLYLQASRVPPRYQPMHLSPAQQAQALQVLENRAAEFVSEAGAISSHHPVRGQPKPPRPERMVFVISQQELTAWLVALGPATQHGLLRAGLAEPAAAIDDGRIVLFARSLAHDKILALELTPELTPERQFRLELTGVRVGRLRLPQRLVRNVRRQLRAQLGRSIERASLDDPDGRPWGVEAPELAQGREGLLRVLAGEPVDPVIRTRLFRVRIDRIELDDGLLRIEAEQLEPAS